MVRPGRPLGATTHSSSPGQNEKYMIKELRKFKWGDGVDPTQQMNDVAIDLSEEQILARAKYSPAGIPCRWTIAHAPRPPLV